MPELHYYRRSTQTLSWKEDRGWVWIREEFRKFGVGPHVQI